MSYASRLIADMAGPRAGRPAAQPIPRPDVDVIEEGPPALVSMAMPALAAVPTMPADKVPDVPPVPVPVPTLAWVGLSPAEPTATDPVPLHRVPIGEAPMWTVVASNETPDSLAEPSSPRAQPSIAVTPASTPVDVTERQPLARLHEPWDTVAAPGEHVGPRSSGAAEPPGDGIPWRRLSGVDVSSPPSPQRAAADPTATALTSAVLGDPEPHRSPRPQARPDARPAEPDVQNLSLSIGSIEVIVDAPPMTVAATHSVPPPPLPPARSLHDDPIMRLRRQYVTWPEGG